MTKDRSSIDAFRLFLSQLKHQSSLVHVMGATKRLPTINLVGRITAVGDERFTLKGRGCELDFDFAAARMERWVPTEMPVVPIRVSDDPRSSLRAEWRVSWRNGDLLLIGESLRRLS